jgi:hypothetical protein
MLGEPWLPIKIEMAFDDEHTAIMQLYFFCPAL